MVYLIIYNGQSLVIPFVGVGVKIRSCTKLISGSRCLKLAYAVKKFLDVKLFRDLAKDH